MKKKLEEKQAEKTEEQPKEKPEEKAEDAAEANEIKTASDDKRWILGAVLGGLAALLIGAYIVTAVHYKNHFFPGTVINGIDYSNGSTADVLIVLMTELRGYRLEVIGRDSSVGEKSVLAEISAQDVDLRASVGEADIQEIMDRQNEWLWPSMFRSSGYVYNLNATYALNRDKLESYLEAQPAFQQQNMQAPEDAYLKGYSESEKCFVLEPEVSGTQIDFSTAAAAVSSAIEEGRESLDLEEEGFYIKPAVTSESADLQEKLRQANRLLETRITYDWNDNEVVLDGERIKDWVTIEDGTAVLDEKAVAGFVAENAKKYDTYNKNRNFLTTLGISLTLPSAGFGWLTDRKAEAEALIELIKEGTIADREPIYSSKAPWKGTNDIGNSYVEADMTNQHLYLYEKGELKLESDFVSGNMAKGYTTPQGVFGLTYKTMNAVLRGRDYVTPVTYWMPFYGNYGMHDATWRSAFGGDIYLTDGSHGCLNLPLDKAEEIYSYVKTGFPVICYYYPEDVLAATEPAAGSEADPAADPAVQPETEPTTVSVTEG